MGGGDGGDWCGWGGGVTDLLPEVGVLLLECVTERLLLH